MTLLFCDSFNHVESAYANLKWDSSSGATYASGRGRISDWGMYFSTFGGECNKALPSTHQTIILGAAYYSSDLSGPLQTSVRLYDSTTIQVQFGFNADGSITAYRGGSSLGSTAAGVIQGTTWLYLEFKVVIDNSSGSVVIRKNGTQVLSLTSVDTQETSNAYCDNFTIKNSGSSLDNRFDDLYVCDSTGSKNNDFLGDVSIKVLYPTSDGTHTDFTPSTGSDHYALVDEAQLSGASDYNESSTIGHKDSYGVTTFSESGSILGVQVAGAVLNSSTGTMKVRTLCRSGVTPADNEGADFSISQTMKAALTIHEQEPTDTVDWTSAKVNAAEFGLKVSS